jgi:pimeloyl-ACP methyl ester carboxylesterase
VPPFVVSIGTIWANERWSTLYRRLSSFARLIVFDKRGTGLSDRVRDIPTLETRADDIRAVADAVGLERSVLVGAVEGAAIAGFHAAAYPEQALALVMIDPTVRGLWAPDYPWTSTEDEWRDHLASIRARWGERGFFQELLQIVAPSVVEDEHFVDWCVRHMRLAASPGAAATQRRMQMTVDVRDALPTIGVPPLVVVEESSCRRRRSDMRQSAFPEQPWSSCPAKVVPSTTSRIRSSTKSSSSSRVSARSLFPTRCSRPSSSPTSSSQPPKPHSSATPVGRTSAAAPRGGSPPTRSISRKGARYGRRRILRQLRRPTTRDPLRTRHPGCGARTRSRDSFRPPRGRLRG